MITITVRSTMNDKFDICVEPKNIKNAIVLVQESGLTKEFKISLSEGILVTDLYKDFGMGHCSKFVTEFNWQKF